MVIGDSGIIKKAILAREKTNNAQEEADSEISKYGNKIDEAINGIAREGGASDVITCYLDGKILDDIPKKESGYHLESITCTEGAEAEFNTSVWELTISKITNKNVKCTLNFTEKGLYTILESNLEKDEALAKIFSDENRRKEFINDKNSMEVICENSKLRELLYNNYTVTQPIIANSTTAIEVIKNSSNYKSITCSSYSRVSNSSTPNTVLDKKVFLLSVEITYLTYTGLNIGTFTDGTSNYLLAAAGSGGWTGEKTINKFMTKITGAKVDAENNPVATYYYLEI